jgi:hypothetical protein
MKNKRMNKNTHSTIKLYSQSSVIGYEMLKQMDLTQKQVLADRAYDTIRILNLQKSPLASVCIHALII